MKAFINHFSFEFRSGIRNKKLLLMNYLFPLGFYLVIGAIMPSINPLFRPNIVPAMVVFGILSATLMGIPEPLVTARENGIFRSFKINGVPNLSILVIPALTTALHLVIMSAIITFTAPLLFQAPLPVNWGGFLLVFGAMTVACAGISVLIGVISSNSGQTIFWSQIIFLPSMLLGGLMLPYSMLKGLAAKAAELLPATHAINALNGLAMGRAADFNPWGSVIILVTSGFLAFGLAVYLFSWDRRNTARRGSTLLGLLVLLPYVVGMVVLG